MMRCFRSRPGSALLVVLGMLSFMLFSGLAFSVYMRYSRLPTSFLRRTVTTRQLAKAALAEAIEHIDEAIGNDPHPGVRASGKAFDEDALDNFWSHRVFIGVGSTGSDKKNGSNEQPADGDIYPAYADADETVATLTLEGLAYLPPNLINEARYYSKLTPTAKWHSFWFDSGRYAYTAIDVSDYFDVNRIVADKYARAASGSRRLSFAHLFEPAGHEQAGSDAAKWDTFMDQVRKVNDDDSITFNTVPFVSLADFNIAFAQASVGDMKSPFKDFIDKNGVPYDCGDTADDPDAETYRGMTFVTDGWFPKPDRASDSKVLHCSLDNPAYQPFKKSELERENAKYSIDDIATYGHSDQGMQTWAVTTENELRLNHLNFAALWDYLDVDSIPVSLCVPTVERTPMICGVRPSVNSGNIDLTVKKDPKADAKGETKELNGTKWDYYSREVVYSLDATKLQDAVNGAQVLLTYPFQEHGRKENLSRNFKVDGRVAVFLSDAGSGGDTVPIRPTKFTAFLLKNTIDKTEVTEKSLLSFPLSSQSVTPQSIIGNSTKKEMPCMMMALTVGSGSLPDAQLTIARVKYTWPRDKHEVDPTTGEEKILTVNPDPVIDSSKEYYAETTVDSVTDTNLHPLQSNGAAMDDNSIKAKFQSKNGEIKLKANVAVWVRVTDKDGETVDLVPASQYEDENFIGCQKSQVTDFCSGGFSEYPLMRLVANDAEGSLAYSLKNLDAGKLGAVAFPDTKWIVADPRYNHSPENWVQSGSGDVPSGGELQASDWTDNAAILSMVEAGDGDVFMSTSDAGYMQSVYELAFLPRTSNGFSASGRGNPFYGNLNVTFKLTDFPAKFAEAQDYNNSSGQRLMWRTYSPFDAGEFSELETIFEPSEGMTVNPYSDDQHVLMAAFANTPHDWRVAATNDDAIFGMTATEFNKQHAWNAYSSDETGKICWDCMEDFAKAFSEDARSTRDWETAFRNLGWSKNKRKLLDDLDELDGDDSDLYSVDKKFLYGFWHDCFAVRQQLFLIFVRAEPMMMGGGVKGQIPPQLGARAVALVWRDPTKTASRGSSDGSASSLAYPHRTRILFYHQFD